EPIHRVAVCAGEAGIPSAVIPMTGVAPHLVAAGTADRSADGARRRARVAVIGVAIVVAGVVAATIATVVVVLLFSVGRRRQSGCKDDDRKSCLDRHVSTPRLPEMVAPRRPSRKIEARKFRVFSGQQAECRVTAK